MKSDISILSLLKLRDLILNYQELTLGDIVEVKFGDRLPADIR